MCVQCDETEKGDAIQIPYALLCAGVCRFEFEFRLARATPLALPGTTYDDGNAFSVIPIEEILPIGAYYYEE